MSKDTYRNLHGTPEYLTDMTLSNAVEAACGPEGLGLMISAVNAYFRGEGSRAEIAAKIENPGVCVGFLAYCDRIDEKDEKWMQRGSERSKKSGSATDKSVFHPPQTESERQAFIHAVAAFAKDNGFVGFNAEEFVQSLELKEWKTVRGAVLVCWKQAARKWHNNRIRKDDLNSVEATVEGPDKPEVEAAQNPVSEAESYSTRDSSHAVAVSNDDVVTSSDDACLDYCIQAAGGKMTAAVYRELQQYSKSLPEEMIIRAADLAAEKASYDRAAYIRTVLRNWKAEEKRIADVRARNRHQNDSSSASAGSYPQRPIDPDAATERARRSLRELRARYGTGKEQAEPCFQ